MDGVGREINSFVPDLNHMITSNSEITRIWARILQLLAAPFLLAGK